MFCWLWLFVETKGDGGLTTPGTETGDGGMIARLDAYLSFFSSAGGLGFALGLLI